MNKIILDGREVNVGDKLWSCVYGWGVVQDINPVVWSRPLTMMFSVGLINYTRDGRGNYDQLRTLFWNEIDMTPPAPPKQKIKRWKWVFVDRRAGTDYGVSAFHFKDEDEFNRFHPNHKAIQKIDSTMIEVEE